MVCITVTHSCISGEVQHWYVCESGLMNTNKILDRPEIVPPGTEFASAIKDKCYKFFKDLTSILIKCLQLLWGIFQPSALFLPAVACGSCTNHTTAADSHVSPCFALH